MRRTYRVTHGHQYDKSGALVARDGLYARYNADGSFAGGEPVRLADDAAVADAVARVIATGEPETLTLGAEPVRRTAEEIAQANESACRMHQWEETDI